MSVRFLDALASTKDDVDRELRMRHDYATGNIIIEMVDFYPEAVQRSRRMARPRDLMDANNPGFFLWLLAEEMAQELDGTVVKRQEVMFGYE